MFGVVLVIQPPPIFKYVSKEDAGLLLTESIRSTQSMRDSTAISLCLQFWCSSARLSTATWQSSSDIWGSFTWLALPRAGRSSSSSWPSSSSSLLMLNWRPPIWWIGWRLFWSVCVSWRTLRQTLMCVLLRSVLSPHSVHDHHRSQGGDGESCRSCGQILGNHHSCAQSGETIDRE